VPATRRKVGAWWRDYQRTVASAAVIIVRPFADDDWAQIYPFFREIVADGRTYAYPEGLSSEGARSLWVGEPPDAVLVAVDEKKVVGTAKMGPNRPGRGAHIATASFMVDPSARSRGVGRALGDAMVDWARRDGYQGIQFNAVVETNTGAVRLWQSLGFEILTTVPEAFDDRVNGLVGLHVMFKRLGSGGS
jgi:GNAT superfamily N-acetyltransferase